MRRAIGLAILLATTGACAQPFDAGGPACGGNAYASAEVTEGRGVRHGPLTAVPDTLCADIEDQRPPVRIDLYGVPARDGSRTGLGGGAQGAPYDGRSRRGAKPAFD